MQKASISNGNMDGSGVEANGDVKRVLREERSALSDSGSYDSHAAVYHEDNVTSKDADNAADDNSKIAESDIDEEINNIRVRADDYTNWRSRSENSWLGNGSVTGSIPEVVIDGETLSFHMNSNKERSKPSLSARSSITPNSDGLCSTNRDLKGRPSSGYHDSSYESSAETRRSYMNLKGATWPLAEGLSTSFSSASDSVSVENRSNQNTSFTQSCPADVNHTNVKVTVGNEEEKDDEEEGEKAFSIRALTREQLIILIATSFTNLLSFLSLSILAPFFPAEVSRILCLLQLSHVTFILLYFFMFF